MHFVMVDTVQEREEMSVDKRLAYEFPAELDDIDTMALSTKQITKDLDQFEHNFCNDKPMVNASSSEMLGLFPSCESINEIYCKQESSFTTKNQCEFFTVGTNHECDEEKPVYTEVVALKRSECLDSLKQNEQILPSKSQMIIIDEDLKKSFKLNQVNQIAVKPEKMNIFASLKDKVIKGENIPNNFEPKTNLKEC